MIVIKGEEHLNLSDLAKKHNIARVTLNGILHDKFILRLNKAHPKALEQGLMIKRKGGYLYTPSGQAEVQRILTEANKI